jgi:serine/threonine protein kinase
MGESPLHLVKSGSICKLLLCYGWSPEVLDNLGNNPLHSAVASNNFEVCLAILEYGGFNPNILSMKNKERCTPLGLATIGSDISELLFDECSTPQIQVVQKERKTEIEEKKPEESYRKKRIEESKKKIEEEKRKIDESKKKILEEKRKIEEEKKGKMLAKGSYGKVYLSDCGTKVTKIAEVHEVDEVVSRNIAEGIFLSTIKTDFISDLKKVKATYEGGKVKITMTQKFHGKTLREWCDNVKLVDRMVAFPKVVCQLARILLLLKKLNVAHNDIKPENICITDKSQKLTLIDFGFVAIVNKSLLSSTVRQDIMTQNEILNRSIFRMDMFAAGMTLYYIMCKSYIVFEENVDVMGQLLSGILQVKKQWPEFCDLLEKMLRNQITPEELYAKYPEYQKLYPLDQQIGGFAEIPSQVSVHKGDFRTDYSLENVQRILDWMVDVLNYMGSLHMFTYSYQIFNRLFRTSTSLWDVSKAQLKACSCLYIASVIYSDEFDLEKLAALTDSTYTDKEIINDILLCLQEMSWKIYPKSRLSQDELLSIKENKNYLKTQLPGLADLVCRGPARW